MPVHCAVRGCQTSIRPVPYAVPSFHRLQQAECSGLTAWAASNTQWSHEGSLSLPPGTQGKTSDFSFLSLNTPLGPLGLALGQTSRVQGKKTGDGGEKPSLKLCIFYPEMGKTIVLLQDISCYNFFFTLPLANSSIKESWFFFPLPSMRCSLLQTVGTQSPKIYLGLKKNNTQTFNVWTSILKEKYE